MEHNFASTQSIEVLSENGAGPCTTRQLSQERTVDVEFTLSSLPSAFLATDATMAEPPSPAHKVELYCYDLSGGLARQLSASLLGGHQIDAVWHTSIVAHNQEVFFGGGEGISITAPGRSHHGNPIQVVQLGTTEIDRETFDMLIEDLRERFTASSYNLFNYNCNNFSDEFSKILVGKGIPEHILAMPADFQTALRNMGNRGAGGAGPSQQPGGAFGGGPGALSGYVDMINERAQQSTTSAPAPASTSAAAPAAPAASNHPHTNLTPPVTSIDSLPGEPTYFTSAINYDAVIRSLDETLRSVRAPDFSTKADMQEARKVVAKEVVPWLQQGASGSGANVARKNVDAALLQRWSKANSVLCKHLPTKALFPLVDLLRVAAADSNATNQQSYASVNLFQSTIDALAAKLTKEGDDVSTIRSTWMTTLWLVGNAAGRARYVGASSVTLLVAALLHTDLKVANVAATATYNACLALSAQMHAQGGESAAAVEVSLEILTALLESLKRDDLPADTVHRLAAAVARLVWLFPDQEALSGLAEVLEAESVLKEAAGREVVIKAESRKEIEALLGDCARLMK